MGWKDRIETNLRNLSKDLTSEILVVGNITFLLREDTVVDTETIQQLAGLDDPLIRSLYSFLKWKLNNDFGEIRDFFSSLKSAMTKYANYNYLNTALLELFIEKRIQFNLYNELENDLLDLEYYLVKTLDYTLAIEQK